MHPIFHSQSAVKKWGGKVEDYLPIHDFFDSTKAHFSDFRHRAMLHNSYGIYLAERIFGHTITNSDGKVIPVRFIAERHILEDCGRIPSVADWLKCIQPEPWMTKVGIKRVEDVK